MLILLPPSEGKLSDAGRGVFGDLNPKLVQGVKPVLKHLRSLDGDAVGKFYGVKKAEKAQEAHRLNLGVLKHGGVRALERYTGVVYQHLEYATLRAKRQADRRVLVVSGMFGLIDGGCRIPNYKLPMNAWLARYWVETNTRRLDELSGKRKVVSLLPQSHAKALSLDGVMHVQFKVAGGKKLAGHFGKAIKGRFVRFLLENNVTSVKDFGDFREDEFRFDGTDFIQS